MEPFLSLGVHDDGADVEASIAREVERGWFVLGPEMRHARGLPTTRSTRWRVPSTSSRGRR
jgi:hypothetical protein